MAPAECVKTDRGRIDRVANWSDHSAWRWFDSTYRPMVRLWGGRLGFRGDDLDELCQAVMVGFMTRSQTFRYDPARTFRGWLRTVVRHRAIEMIRLRRRELPISAAPRDWAVDLPRLADDSTPSDASHAPPGLIAEILDAVRARVSPENWRIFWMVRIEDRPIPDVAAAFHKTYAATYRNQERIARMVREEAQRRLGLPPA